MGCSSSHLKENVSQRFDAATDLIAVAIHFTRMADELTTPNRKLAHCERFATAEHNLAVRHDGEELAVLPPERKDRTLPMS